MTRVLGLATCFNRKEKSINAIRSLTGGNPSLTIDFIIVDDNSSDGTSEALNKFDNVIVLHGDGNLYYCGGMRMAIAAAKKTTQHYDYCLLFNDDVEFYDHCIEYLVSKAKKQDAVWVGPTCDENGKLVYSGIVRKSKYRPKYKHLLSETDEGVECETLNGNCVLIPWHIFMDVDNMPSIYRQYFSDYHYGFEITRKGYKIMAPDQFIGMCKDDTKKEHSWRDPSLSIIERIQKKESVKGLPFREYFYYLNHNFNFLTAVVYSVSPYLKMLVGK